MYCWKALSSSTFSSRLPKNTFSFCPLLLSSSISLSLHGFSNHYQSCNGDEQLTSITKHVFVFLHVLTTSGEDVDLLCFLLSLHVCKRELCTCGTHLCSISKGSSEYKYPAPKDVSTLGCERVIDTFLPGILSSHMHAFLKGKKVSYSKQVRTGTH